MTALLNITAAGKTASYDLRPLFEVDVSAIGFTGEITFDFVLGPLECSAIENAAPPRRRDFMRGRFAARAALAGLQRNAIDIPRSPNGPPIWPSGIVGSVSHCHGLTAAAVTFATQAAALGIDAEPLAPVSQDLQTILCRPAEIEWCMREEHSMVDPLLLTFCAKEAFYKAFFPLHARVLEFLDVELRIAGGARSGQFKVEWISPAVSDRNEAERYVGRWQVFGEHLICGVTLPRI